MSVLSTSLNFQRPDNSAHPLLCLPDEIKLEVASYLTSWPDFLAFRQTCIDLHRISEDHHGLLRKYTHPIHTNGNPICNTLIDKFGTCCESLFMYTTSPFFALLKHLKIKIPTPEQCLKFPGFNGDWTDDRAWDSLCFTSNMINIMFIFRKTFINPDFPRFPTFTTLLQKDNTGPAPFIPPFFGNKTTADEISENLKLCPFRLNPETSGLFETKQAIRLLRRRINSIAREARDRVEFLDNVYNFENPEVAIPTAYPTHFAEAQKEKATLERFDRLARKIDIALSDAEESISLAKGVISPTLNQLLASWTIPWIGLFWIADTPEAEPKNLALVIDRLKKLESHSTQWHDWSKGLHLLTQRIVWVLNLDSVSFERWRWLAANLDAHGSSSEVQGRESARPRDASHWAVNS